MTRHCFLLFALLALLALPAFSWDWPVPNAPVVSNFGEAAGNGPQLGYAFSTTGPVKAVESGELLFQSEDDGSDPLGNWVAVRHSEGMVSMYSRLASLKPAQVAQPATDTVNDNKDNAVKAGQVIGQSGATGWSADNGFTLSIYDTKEAQGTNPAALLPPLIDTRPPIIGRVSLKSVHSDAVYPITAGTAVPQGRYIIFVRIIDTMQSSDEVPLAPYAISTAVNGVGSGSLQFETIAARDGKTMLLRGGLVPASEAYSSELGIGAGETLFVRGQATLEITASDKAIPPNQRSAVYHFIVQ
jgi:hypothetical protein